MKETIRLIGLYCAIISLIALGGCGAARHDGTNAGGTAKDPEAVVEAPQAGAVANTPQPDVEKQTQTQDPAAAKKQKALKAIRSMDKMGDKAVYHLSELSQMRDRDIRLAAVETLGAIESPCALDPLISALADNDHVIRQTAARLLIYRGPLLTRVHVDRLVFIMRNANKCWPDPAMTGAVIYAKSLCRPRIE